MFFLLYIYIFTYVERYFHVCHKWSDLRFIRWYKWSMRHLASMSLFLCWALMAVPVTSCHIIPGDVDHHQGNTFRTMVWCYAPTPDGLHMLLSNSGLMPFKMWIFRLTAAHSGHLCWLGRWHISLAVFVCSASPRIMMRGARPRFVGRGVPGSIAASSEVVLAMQESPDYWHDQIMVRGGSCIRAHEPFPETCEGAKNDGMLLAVA